MSSQLRFQLIVLGISVVVMISAFIGYNIPTIREVSKAFIRANVGESKKSQTVDRGQDCSSLVGKVIMYQTDIEKNGDVFEYLKANKLTYGWGYIVKFSSVKVLVVDVPKDKEDVWMRNIKSRFSALSPMIAEDGYRIGQNGDQGEYPLGMIEIMGSKPEVDQYLKKKQLRKLNGFGELAEYAVPCGEEVEWVKKINSAGFGLSVKASLAPVVKLY